MARQYSNTTLETTLSASIDSSETSMQIGATTGLPVTFPYSLVLDYQTTNVEVVTVTGVSGSTLTVTRGQDGTAASAHDTGAVVVHGVTARDLAEPQAHIDASSGVHGLEMGSNLVGTAMTQTLTNKTIDGNSNTLANITADSLANVELGDLDDVDTSGASNGDLLIFSGDSWAPAAPSAPSDAGTIVKVFTGIFNGITDTSSTSFVSSGLSLSFTPLFSNSQLVVFTSGRGESASSGAASSRSRRSTWRIRDITNGSTADGAFDGSMGREMVDISTSSAASNYSVSLVGRFSAGNTSARTIRLEMRSPVSSIDTSFSEGLMVVMEVRPL